MKEKNEGILSSDRIEDNTHVIYLDSRVTIRLLLVELHYLSLINRLTEPGILMVREM
jgi:hypothetical protein